VGGRRVQRAGAVGLQQQREVGPRETGEVEEVGVLPERVRVVLVVAAGLPVAQQQDRALGQQAAQGLAAQGGGGGVHAVRPLRR
jgi:hypothetical protein